MTTVSVQNVSKRFGKTVAILGVSVEVQPGEILALLGPSGSGKTTLLRCIAGFYQPEEGAIFFDGTDVTHLPPHLRNCAMMFPSGALWPHLTVARNVAFGLEERKVSASETESRVEEALAKVRIAELAGRRITELSDGQQQRVALARALVVKPRCLLLDAPLSKLDAKLGEELRAEIRRVCKESQLTAIYVSHDQKEALAIADRLAILDRGNICQIGLPREIYQRPANRFVAEFLGATNFLSGKIETMTDGSALVSTPIGMLRGTVRGKMQRGDAVTLSIRPEAWKFITGANAIKGRIVESVYLGEMARHRFAVGEGTPFTVYELNPRAEANGEIMISVNPADVLILRDDESGPRALAAPPK